MSEFNDQSDDSADGSTRRSVLGSTALATLGIGLGSAGTVAAQEGGDVGVLGDDDNTGDEEWFDDENAYSAAMYRDQWVPNGLFTIASPVVDFSPEAPGIANNPFTSYNTRIIRYIGTNEHVLFFPYDEADLGPYEEDIGYVVDEEDDVDAQRPTIWIMSRENEIFGGDQYVISVDFSPIPQNEEDRVWGEIEDGFFRNGTQQGNQTATPPGDLS